MDFSNRGAQPQNPSVAGRPESSGSTHKKSNSGSGKWGRIGITLGMGAVIVLLIALVAVISFGGPKAESKYVDTSKLQAVFLNTGQVYFGNVSSLNSKYFVLTNIYYLQTSNGSNASTTDTSNTNVSLVKLGCEWHEPLDKMVINSDQVTFWENLGDNGQVAKAVATFEKDNPNGQKCADQSSSASSNSANNTQNAGSGTTTGNGTTTNKPNTNQ
jgi:hypothetical protein